MNQHFQRARSLGLQEAVTCPHCWSQFPPEEILWVSRHLDLGGDPYLGDGENRRFLPTRFTPKGQAIDIMGETCRDLACPRCHLKIPRALVEMGPFYISILGAPSSGKSYYLGTMTWRLRELLRNRYFLGIEDADPEANEVLGKYEDLLFLNDDMDSLVRLGKTELEGELYQRVRFGENEKTFPKPFVFAVRPLENHPCYKDRRKVSRTLCLYDNAGEHFLPGADLSTQPGTQHLALSEALLFLFDPTQHPRMRAKCSEVSDDPQLHGRYVKSYRQDYILLEAAKRIRDYSGLPQTEKYAKPLIVLVAKYDIWKPLLPDIPLESLSVTQQGQGNVRAINLDIVAHVSVQTRNLLYKIAPEFVNAAASFSKEVIYIPVSAFGCSPEQFTIPAADAVSEDGSTQGEAGPVASEIGLGVRPRSIKPIWVEIPILYALAHSTNGLIRLGKDGLLIR